jgi:hypothetical protein
VDDLLSAYLQRTGAGCPNCGHQLDGQPICPGCHHKIRLGLDSSRVVTTLFSRTWAIAIIPWFTLASAGVGSWLYAMWVGTDFLWFPAELSVRVILTLYLQWVVLAAPVVCIYAWLDRRRIGLWGRPAMWIGFSIPALAFLLQLAQAAQLY